MHLIRRPTFTIEKLHPKGPPARSVNVNDLKLPSQGGKDDLQPEASLLDLLSGPPGTEDIEFDIPTVKILLRPIDFD